MLAPEYRKDSFTLVEVMAAMAILSFSFMSLLSLSNSTVRQAMYNRTNTMAVSLARHRMEMLVLKVKRGEMVGSAYAGESEFDYGFQEMVEEDYPGMEIEEEANPVEDLPFEIPDGVLLSQINVTVTWKGGLGEDESFTLESYVATYETNP